jgi:hypothetical protein
MDVLKKEKDKKHSISSWRHTLERMVSLVMCVVEEGLGQM